MSPTTAKTKHQSTTVKFNMKGAILIMINPRTRSTTTMASLRTRTKTFGTMLTIQLVTISNMKGEGTKTFPDNPSMDQVRTTATWVPPQLLRILEFLLTWTTLTTSWTLTTSKIPTTIPTTMLKMLTTLMLKTTTSGVTTSQISEATSQLTCRDLKTTGSKKTPLAVMTNLSQSEFPNKVSGYRLLPFNG
jgi:hypothetical protein